MRCRPMRYASMRYECSAWRLKIFDNGVRERVGCKVPSGRRVSESEVEALCLKNSADRLKNVFNYSGRDTS